MSIRDTMRQRAQDAKSVLSSLKFQRDDLDKSIAVIEFADKVLDSPPKHETKCGLVLHYTQTSGYFQKADCSECSATLQGYERTWKFCPVCGSTVIKTEQEESANDRLTRKALREAVDSLILAGGK